MQDAEAIKTRPSRINTTRRARTSTNISRRAATTLATRATLRHEMETTRARRSREPSTSPRAPSTKMIRTRAAAKARTTDNNAGRSTSRRGRSPTTTRRTSRTRSKATEPTTRRTATDKEAAMTKARINLGAGTKEWRRISLITTSSSPINKICSRWTSRRCESSSSTFSRSMGRSWRASLAAQANKEVIQREESPSCSNRSVKACLQVKCRIRTSRAATTTGTSTSKPRTSPIK